MDNRKDSQSAASERVSHLDLMRLLDGEHLDKDVEFGADLVPLDGDGVRDWEVIEADAQPELFQLSLLGEFVREAVEQDTRADAIVDAVMARIDAQELPEADASLEAELSPKLPLEQVAKAGAANDMGAANDNGRRIFALAAAAAAVAAGLFLWGRSGEDAMRAASAPPDPPAAVMASEEPRPALETLADVAAGDPAQQADQEPDAPVEIAAVDFGRLTGSVFYVPGEDQGGATAVVWVTDSGDEQ